MKYVTEFDPADIKLKLELQRKSGSDGLTLVLITSKGDKQNLLDVHPTNGVILNPLNNDLMSALGIVTQNVDGEFYLPIVITTS